VGHGACMGEIRNAYRTLEEDLKRADYLRDKDINGRIILKWVARRCGSIHLDSVVSLFFFFRYSFQRMMYLNDKQHKKFDYRNKHLTKS